MNKTNVQKLIDHLEDTPDSAFGMRYWNLAQKLNDRPRINPVSTPEPI